MIEFFQHQSLWEWDTKHFGTWACLLVTILALVRYRYLSSVQKWVLAFSLFSFCMDYVSTHFLTNHLFHEHTNSGWYHLGTPILFWLICRIQAFQLVEEKRYWLEKVLPLLFLFVAIVQVLLLIPFDIFPTITVGLYALTGIILPIGYFLSLLQSLHVEYVEQDPLFWISTGMILYFSANFLLWCALTFLAYERASFFSIYRINAFATVLLYLFFAVALFLPGRNTRPAALKT